MDKTRVENRRLDTEREHWERGGNKLNFQSPVLRLLPLSLTLLSDVVKMVPVVRKGLYLSLHTMDESPAPQRAS